MLSIIGKRFLSYPKVVFKQNLRYFLSNSYKCQESWEQRKQATIFQKVDYDDLYHQLDRCFQTGQRISILDVDVFLNGIRGESYQNELEDVIYKLRMNPECALLTERTMHAVVKFYMDADKKKDLLHILSNRLTYGIFLDDFSANMLMDAFLKENDTASAVKVAVLVMLQEDFSHPITKNLALCCCYKYLKSEDVWELPKAEEVDPDEDEIKVRVGYLRNEYFDDHFDLTDPNHLVGKTMVLAGTACSGTLGTTSQLIGFVLWEKYDAAELLIQSGVEFIADGLEMAAAFVKKRPKIEASNEISDEKTRFLEQLGKAKTVPGDIGSISVNAVSTAVAEYESTDIDNLTEVYKNWQKDRENDLQKELFESKKRKTLEEIAQMRTALEKEEQIIFYFDKEDEWDLRVEEKQNEIREFQDRISTQKKKKNEDVQYIPPEVGQKNV